jgi:hypothetical protein
MNTHIRNTLMFVLTMTVAFQFVVAACAFRSAMLLSTTLPHEFQYLALFIF